MDVNDAEVKGEEVRLQRNYRAGVGFEACPVEKMREDYTVGIARPKMLPLAQQLATEKVSVRLANAGLPAAPGHFTRASGAASLGVAPGADAVLEADMMVEHVAAMVEDLLAQRCRSFCGRSSPWREAAARNSRSLLSSYTACFRERRGAGAIAAAAGGSQLLTGPHKEKPPADSFEVVEPATRAADRQLAVSTDLLQGLTAVAALRREHVRESRFKNITSSLASVTSPSAAGRSCLRCASSSPNEAGGPVEKRVQDADYERRSVSSAPGHVEGELRRAGEEPRDEAGVLAGDDSAAAWPRPII
ncbi:MAG: hypothetical protein SGPRY_012535 [Prymnesium sp.]